VGRLLHGFVGICGCSSFLRGFFSFHFAESGAGSCRERKNNRMFKVNEKMRESIKLYLGIKIDHTTCDR
jgi:hypothetical protein